MGETSAIPVVVLSRQQDPVEIINSTLRNAGQAVHCTWVRELAGTVHGFYHDCYVVAPSVPPELTQARLWLVEAARVGLVVGLDLLGVGAPDRME